MAATRSLTAALGERYAIEREIDRGGTVMVSMRKMLLAVMMAGPVAISAQPGADHLRAGRIALSANDANAAVKAFEKAVAAEPGNADYHLWLARAVGTVAQNASVLRQPFLARRAKAEFEKTVQLDPDNLGGRDGMMQFYLFAPGVMGGSVAKAREQAEEIAKLNKLRGHFARATIANHEKDPSAAEREIRAAAAENPDSLSAITSLVSLLAGSSRADEAFATLDRYLARKPGDVTATFWIGRVAAVSGHQLDRGEQALRGVLSAPGVGTEPGLPTLFAVHYWLGNIAAKRGNKELARKEYEKAIEINPRFEAAKRALKAL